MKLTKLLPQNIKVPYVKFINSNVKVHIFIIQYSLKKVKGFITKNHKKKEHPIVKKKNNLFIIQNGQINNDLTTEGIFNKKFHTLYAITYSIDNQFLTSYANHFQNATFIIGIQDFLVQQRAIKQLSSTVQNLINHTISNEMYQNIHFFENLSNHTKDKVSNKEIEIKVPIGFTIHSKVYLMKNDTETRVVIGSANLSKNAFDYQNQYEIIHIIDNDQNMFDLHMSYFESIKEKTTDFISQTIIDAYKNKKASVKKTSQPNTNITININVDANQTENTASNISDNTTNPDDMIIRFSNNEKSELQLTNQVELMEQLKNVMDDDDYQNTLKDIDELGSQARSINANEKEKVSLVQSGIEIVKASVKLDKGEYKKVTPGRYVQAIKPKFKINEVVDVTDSIPERSKLISIPIQRHQNNSGLYHTPKNTTIIEQSFGQYASKEQIKRAIHQFNQFMKNYESYVIDYDHNYGMRIFEIILYAFTSPFMSEIRQKVTTDSERLDIPQFLIIGGRAGSGKSNLLDYINKLLGLNNTQKPMLYNTIVPTSVHQQKSKINTQLGLWLIEDNVNPLLIDEIDNDFFTNDKRGNELIVNVSNQNAREQNLTPCFIGTTNADDYTLPERAQRRTQYIKINKAFDINMKQESNKLFLEIYEQIDNTLFQDFVLRFSQKLNDELLNWSNYATSNITGLIDYLYHTREIFKEYFEIAEEPIPNWFPKTRYDDALNTNIQLWRSLYLFNTEAFKYTVDSENNDQYLFDLNTLNQNTSGRNSANVSTKYRDALSPKVIKNTSSGNILILKVKEFHDWIDIINPHRKKTATEKLKDFFKL